MSDFKPLNVNIEFKNKTQQNWDDAMWDLQQAQIIILPDDNIQSIDFIYDEQTKKLVHKDLLVMQKIKNNLTKIVIK